VLDSNSCVWTFADKAYMRWIAIADDFQGQAAGYRAADTTYDGLPKPWDRAIRQSNDLVKSGVHLPGTHSDIYD
jgi:hypothetical protein